MNDENLRTIDITIPEELWLPVGPDDDPRSQLGIVLAINGTRHYIDAYAVHAYPSDACDCAIDANGEDLGDGWIRDNRHTLGEELLHAAHEELDEKFIELVDAHGVTANPARMTIAGRSYVLFAEPAGA